MLKSILKKNKSGAAYIFDAAVALLLLNTIMTLFYWALSFHNKNVMTAEQNFYEESLLTECAEVVHATRYGEWDSAWELGWNAFQRKYPTGMYTINYNEATKSYSLEKLMHSGGHVLTPEDAETLWVVNQLEKIYYKTQNGETAPLTNIGPDDYALRAVYINNNSPIHSDVRCIIKTNKFHENEANINAYRDLKFTMMNYI